MPASDDERLGEPAAWSDLLNWQQGRTHEFELDTFQRKAVNAVGREASVLVAAPTGSGKTVVAEAAVADALERSQRAFYTTPIKALSNQKFHDLSELFGTERVGLLTGDNVIRPDAEVVVMTTEVLRNMIYSPQSEGSLERLRWVVLDEVHYLGNPYRGAVWEEVIISAPASVRFVCLSATISNAPAFGRWLASLRGEVEVVVSKKRPVELRSLHMVQDGHQGNGLVVFPPLNEHGSPHQKWSWIATEKDRGYYEDGYYDDYDYGWGGYRSWRFHTPKPSQVLGHLKQHQMLPAIYFVFSRDGCDRAAMQLAGARLIGDDDIRAIAEIAERRLQGLTEADREDLQIEAWLLRIRSGVASHHAGLAPVLKEIVEECFIKGHIKVVFATETLALGMNMPARSVVLNSLTKFNGTSFPLLRPSEYAQMAGRAGRRGIDDLGHCVTLWSPHIASSDVVALDRSQSFPLNSAFSPNYNMVANLAARHARPEAEAFLRQSFAQFLLDEKTGAQRKSLEGVERKLAEARSFFESLPDDITEHGELLAAAAERQAELLGRSNRGLKRGDVIADPRGGEGRFVVVAINRNRKSAASPLNFITPNGGWRSVVVAGPDLPQPICRVQVPQGTIRKKGKADFKKAASTALRTALGEGLAVHNAKQLEVSVDKARGTLHKTANRSELTKTMLAVSKVLTDLGYLNDGWHLTEAGRMLAGIHQEQDLLVAETLRLGLLEGLDTAELVAVASTIVYEHRSKSPPMEPVWPSEQCKVAVDEINGVRALLHSKEKALGIELTPQSPRSDGFFNHAYAWAAGASMSVATGTHMGAGDFVRNIHLTTDLLRQIARVASDGRLQREARRAARRITRGVVIADAVSQAERSDRPRSRPDEHTASEPPEALTRVLAAISLGTPRTSPADSPRPSQPFGSGSYEPPSPQFDGPRDYYSVSSLKHRGWTDAMIRDLLGDPDKRGANPHYRSSAKTRLYLITRVEEVEATEQFAQRLDKANARRVARKQSVGAASG